MTTQVISSTASAYRSAGRAAIASGITGIVAAGFLVAFLVYRGQSLNLGTFLLRFHDFGVSIQFLFMIPVAVALQSLSQQTRPGRRQPAVTLGTVALSFTSLFLILIFPKVVSDGLYTFPQGVFGVWLIIVNLRLTGNLPGSLRWFGIVVGAGLMIVGLFSVGYAIFVSPIMLRIPAAPLEEVINIPHSPANIFLHYFIWIGSFMGVFPLPFWTILLGRILFLRKN
jgi:hypothetical protein